MKKNILITILSVLGLVSCENKSNNIQSETKNITIESEGVQLIDYSIEAGDPSTKSIETGLQAAADTLSKIYSDVLKEHPKLTGNIRGAFHIESDGTVRSFMAKGSDFSLEAGKSVSSEFVGATFGKKYSFPKLGEDVLLKIDFQLNNNR